MCYRENCKEVINLYLYIMGQFILLFTGILFLSALIINGWFSITSGRWELNPDGSKYWTGKIFNKYSYWLQRHTIDLVPYGNEEFLKMYYQFKGIINDDDVLSVGENWVIIKKPTPKKAALIFSYAASKGITIKLLEMPEDIKKDKDMMLAIYKPVKKYVMHELLRDPLGMCINCMASIFGTILWIIWVLISGVINDIYPTDSVTAFLGLGLFAKFLLWGMFCVSLAYLNEFIFNLNAKLKR